MEADAREAPRKGCSRWRVGRTLITSVLDIGARPSPLERNPIGACGLCLHSAPCKLDIPHLGYTLSLFHRTELPDPCAPRRTHTHAPYTGVGLGRSESVVGRGCGSIRGTNSKRSASARGGFQHDRQSPMKNLEVKSSLSELEFRCKNLFLVVGKALGSKILMVAFFICNPPLLHSASM